MSSSFGLRSSADTGIARYTLTILLARQSNFVGNVLHFLFRKRGQSTK